jgi:hypothetical protein
MLRQLPQHFSFISPFNNIDLNISYLYNVHIEVYMYRSIYIQQEFLI